MSPLHNFLKSKRILPFPVILILLLVVACGSAATATPPPPNTPVPTTAATQPTPTPPTALNTPTPTVEVKATTGGTLLPGVDLADLSFIQDAEIQSPRGSSKGTLTVAQHFGLSPTWFDPQEQGATAIQQAFSAIFFDSMLIPSAKGMFTYGLAEHMEMTSDYTKAAFRLRKGVRFQDGQPLTTEDVKWNYENYRGFHAGRLQDKLDASRADGGIEIVDDQVIIFHFNEPFIDFIHFYNGVPTGIGWIVPKHYYEEVGPEGFKQNPMGSGPFKFVSQEVGSRVEAEANPDYWRRVPGPAKLIVVKVDGFAQRLAALKTGEVDLAYGLTGQILTQVLEDPDLRWDANYTNPWHLFFPGYQDSASPFNDKRVRHAVSLAINREFFSLQETQGIGPLHGNWIGLDRIGAVADLPLPEFDPEKAKQLLAEAGYSDGLELDGVASFPPYHPMSERIVTDLAAVGISASVDAMDQPVFRGKQANTKDGWQGGKTIINEISVATGPASMEIAITATCDSPASQICEPYIEERWKKFQASLDPDERDQLLADIQTYVIDEYLTVPIYINPFVHAIGTNVLPEGDGFHKYWALPQTAFPWPWDEWELKE